MHRIISLGREGGRGARHATGRHFLTTAFFSDSAALKKLIEIALFTPDVKRTVDFYRKLLGANPTYVSNESAEFELGEAKLFIHVKDESDENLEPDFPPGVDHLAFAVDDIDKACQELKSHGLKPEYGPRDYYWGRSAYLRDPGGRLVELHKHNTPSAQKPRALSG